ncbi:MAG: PSD1 and planctomycete cytochrome C domain-containing protein [bacterium]|nr:PSD1 and planctomycete cytochrome C domain-containing protein [bacterium]
MSPYLRYWWQQIALRPRISCAKTGRLLLAAHCLWLVALHSVHAGENSPAIDFARDIRPILSEYCFQCHGPDANAREADLRLDQQDSAARVTTYGSMQPAPLLERINAVDEGERMPPPELNKQLSAEHKALLQAWVEQGADYQQHWAFQTPLRPELPPEWTQAWCSNPVDAFVLAKLKEQGLEASPAARPATLLRRLFLDLSGLPPQSSDYQRFVANVERDGLERALEQVVARLLASRNYGEHMTLPWLEAARYADTDGYQNDRYRYQHAWRDWVLRAFNAKMPYDQFIIEQLAGDLLPSPTLWQQVATGFGRNHRINSEDGSIPAEWLTENVVDRVDTFGTVFLGLTVGCARCHDHKYDPISQRDYYRLFAYFNNIAEHGVGPNNGNSPPFVELPESWPLLNEAQDRFQVPEPVNLRPAREAEGNGLLRPQPGSPQTVMVMHELSQPRPTYLLRRGRYDMPDKSEELSAGVPQSLDWYTDETQRPKNRLELAHWLVDPRNPLTARVAVNRLWQQFFGQGLVETSDNLGAQGSLPTHPLLLDWLAVELVESGWDLSHIQRLIVTSSTYRQTSAASPESLRRDPTNRWLGRSPRLRLPGFILRDQALQMSGLLVQRSGGPSVKPYMPEKIWSSISNNKYVQDQGENLFRRSLYTYWRRTIPPPTMMNFNAAAREVCTVKTEITNTPLQALTLLNNKTFIEAARGLAQRALQEEAADDRSRIAWMFRLANGREPTDQELEVLRLAHQQAAEAYINNPQAADQLLSIGESARNSNLAPAQHAAWTMLASLILNLDETITKE